MTSLLGQKLQEAITSWETKPKGQHRFGITNNVTRSTFNYVRDNPGCTRKSAIEALDAQGFKQASTTSLLSIMTKQRLLREMDDGQMFANVSEYTPLAQSQKKVKKTKTKARMRVEAIPVVHMDVTPPQKRAQLIMHRTPDDMDKYIDTLNVRQAKTLMEKLKAIFGEAV
jgi:hypothetical protein